MCSSAFWTPWAALPGGIALRMATVNGPIDLVLSISTTAPVRS